MTLKDLKRVSLFLVILGGVLFLTDSILSWGAAHNYQNDMGKVNLIMNHRANPDIMIFGSSNVEVGIDAPLLKQLSGRSVFNAALDGTHYQQMASMINEFGEYSSRNRYVILGLSPYTLIPKTKINQIEHFLPQIANPYVYTSLYSMDPDLAFKCRFVPFYKYTQVSSDYYKQVALGWKSHIQSTGQHESPDTLYGFTPNFQTWQRDQDEINASTGKFR